MISHLWQDVLIPHSRTGTLSFDGSPTSPILKAGYRHAWKLISDPMGVCRSIPLIPYQSVALDSKIPHQVLCASLDAKRITNKEIADFDRPYASTFILASTGYVCTYLLVRELPLNPYFCIYYPRITIGGLYKVNLVDTFLLHPRLPVGLQSPSPYNWTMTQFCTLRTVRNWAPGSPWCLHVRISSPGKSHHATTKPL